MIQESQAQLETSLDVDALSSPATSYVEVPSRSSQVDPLTQLRANVMQLESLQSQMAFMVREIKSLTCKRR